MSTLQNDPSENAVEISDFLEKARLIEQLANEFRSQCRQAVLARIPMIKEIMLDEKKQHQRAFSAIQGACG